MNFSDIGENDIIQVFTEGGAAFSAIIGVVVFFGLVRPFLKEFAGGNYGTTFLAIPFLIVAVIIHTLISEFFWRLLADHNEERSRAIGQVISLAIGFVAWIAVFLYVRNHASSSYAGENRRPVTALLGAVAAFVIVAGALITWNLLYIGLKGKTVLDVEFENKIFESEKLSKDFEISRYKKLPETDSKLLSYAGKIVATDSNEVTLLLNGTADELRSWAFLYAEDDNGILEIRIPTDWLDDDNPSTQAGAEVRRISVKEREVKRL